MVTSKDQGFMLPEGFVDECVEYEEVRPVAMWWRYLLALLVILIIGYLFYFLERTKQRPRNDEDDSGATEQVEQQEQQKSETQTSSTAEAMETPYRIVTETNVAQTITIKLADLLQQINLTQIFAVASTEQQQATVRRSSEDLQPNTKMPVNESWDLRDEYYTELSSSQRDSETQSTVITNESDDFSQLINQKNGNFIQQEQIFENDTFRKPETAATALMQAPFDQLEEAINQSDPTANFEHDKNLIDSSQISHPPIYSSQQRPPLDELELLQCTTDENRLESVETNSSSSPFEEIVPSPRSHVSSSGDGSIEMINNDQLQAIENELQEEEDAMLGKDWLTELESTQRSKSDDDEAFNFEMNRSLTPTNELLNSYPEHADFVEENIGFGFEQITEDEVGASNPINITKSQEEITFDDVDEHSPSPRTLPTEISDLTEILLVPKENNVAIHERQLHQNTEQIYETPDINISAKDVEIQEKTLDRQTVVIQPSQLFEEIETQENTGSLNWPNEQTVHENIEQVVTDETFVSPSQVQEKASLINLSKPEALEETKTYTHDNTGSLPKPDEQPEQHENIEQNIRDETLKNLILPQSGAENPEKTHETLPQVSAQPKLIEEIKKLVPQQSGSLDWPDGHVKEKLEFDHYEFLPIGLQSNSDIDEVDIKADMEAICAYAEHQPPSQFTSETIKIDKLSDTPETSTEACIKLQSPTVDNKDVIEEPVQHPLQPQFAPCSKPTLQAKSDHTTKRAQHKQILSSLQQLQQPKAVAENTTNVETTIQKPSDMFQLSAIEIIEPNEKAEETLDLQLEAADGAVEVIKASSSRDEKRLHIPAKKGSRPKIMDFQESLDTTDAPSFSEQFEKLSSLLEPTKLRIISPPTSRKTRTKSKSKPKSDKTQRKRPQTPSSLRACGVTSTQEALLKVQSLEELSGFMKQAGLERTNLIFGIDYTASNKYQGEISFGGRCLHELSNKLLNPYQQVIWTMGRTLAPFATSGIIPAFGFGDQRTTDWSVFPLKTDSYCKSLDEVLNAYNQVTPTIVLAGPTNFAPLIYQSIEICRQMRDYHILVIVADGQVTNERATRRAIVDACKFPLSIVMVGVGDGPWDMMHVFDESLPKRPWDNFHFIDFNEVTKLQSSSPEVAFAVQSLLEIPDQYKRIKKLGLLNFV